MHGDNDDSPRACVLSASSMQLRRGSSGVAVSAARVGKCPLGTVVQMMVYILFPGDPPAEALGGGTT